MCESEVITENDDSQDPACEEFHDEFMMSRWHEPTVMVTRTSVLQDPSLSTVASQRASSQGATRRRYESGARVQRRQGLPWTRQRRLHWFRGPVNLNCGIGREVPADHEAQGQVNAATAA